MTGQYQSILDDSSIELSLINRLEIYLKQSRYDYVLHTLQEIDYNEVDQLDRLEIMLIDLELHYALDPHVFVTKLEDFKSEFDTLSFNLDPSTKAKLMIKRTLIEAKYLIQHRQLSKLIRMLDQAINIFEMSGLYQTELALLYNYQSIAYRLQDQIEKSIELAEQARDIISRYDNIRYLASIYNNLGNAYLYKGDLPMALRYHIEALGYRSQLQNPIDIATSHSNIGTIYTEMGEPERALQQFKMALKYDQMTGNDQDIAISYSNIGNAYRLLGRYEKALHYLRKAMDLEQSLDNHHGVALVGLNIVRIHIYQGEVHRAKELIDQQVKILEQLGNDSDRRTGYIRLGRIEKLVGNIKTAFQYYLQSLKLGIKTQNPNNISESLLYIYQLLSEAEDRLDVDESVLHNLEEIVINLQPEHDVSFVPNRLHLIAIYQIRLQSPANGNQRIAALLDKILAGNALDFTEKRLALFLKAENLLESERFSDEEQLTELHQIADQLVEMAQTHQSKTLWIESYILQAKLAIIKGQPNQVTAYFSTAKQIADSNGLVLFRETVNYEIESYLAKFSALTELDDEPLIQSDEYNAELKRYVKKIITDQLELFILSEDVHVYQDGETLCGSISPPSGRLFCDPCRQLSIKRSIHRIVARYIANRSCYYCFTNPSLAEAEMVIEQYLHSPEVTAIYNEFLEITSLLLSGTISWTCLNPNCTSNDYFELELDEINQLFSN